MNWYLAVLKKYTVFEGRAGRAEYWMFFLVNFVVALIVGVIDGMIAMGALSTLYGLGVLLPHLAVAVRRLHDTNRSGWWVLIGLVPCIGWIVLIIFLAGDTVEPNEFGPPGPTTA